jgi:putative nucleotidyltransferase with HDIG domain
MITSLPLEHMALHELMQSQPRELFQHSHAVARLAGDLAQAAGCTRAEQERIQMGSLLHDIGKQFIPIAILEKQAALSRAEYCRIQQHAWLGYAYLNSFVSDSVLLNTVLYHHERWDGGGYPFRMKADEIPLGARICSLADVWDSLTSDRCYRPAWSLPEAAEYIWDRAGSFFDQALAHEFLNLLETQAARNGRTIRKEPAALPAPNGPNLQRLPLSDMQGGTPAP